METRSMETRSMETRSIKTRSIKTRSIKTRSIKTRSIKTRSIKTRSIKTRSIKTRSIKSKSDWLMPHDAAKADQLAPTNFYRADHSAAFKRDCAARSGGRSAAVADAYGSKRGRISLIIEMLRVSVDNGRQARSGR